MGCVYYYKGILIGNEIQLNDFLIERHKLHSKYGDVVFQRSNRANQVVKIIEETILSESSTYKAKMDEMWRSKDRRLYDSDGEKVIIYDMEHPPFVGVNKYIDKIGEGTSDRIVAEFKPEEFWTRMFARWNSGNFQNDDLIEIIKQVTGDDPTTMTGPFSDETLNSWRAAIEKKWHVQGSIGTAIHAVSEYYFGKEGDSYRYDSIDNDVKNAWINFPNEFKNYVNEETFLKVITMC